MEPKKDPHPLLSQRITDSWLNRRDYTTAELQSKWINQLQAPLMIEWE